MYEYVLFAISVALAAYFFKKDRIPRNLPPGPAQSLVLGNFKDVDRNKIHHSLYKLSQSYGPLFSLRLGTKRVVVFNSPDLLRKAFQSDEYKEVFNDKPQGFYGTHLIFGHKDVLFGPYKEVTFKMKAIMYKGIESLHAEHHVQQEVEDLISRLRETEGRDFDPRTVIEKSMTDLHTKAIKGEVSPEDHELIMEFADSSSSLLQPSTEMTLKLFPFLRHLNTDTGRQFRTTVECRDRMLKSFLDEQKTTFSPDVTRGLVDMCLHIQRSEKSPDGSPWLTDDNIRSIIIDVIGGGVVAGTNGLLAIVLCLAHNPECQKKMQAEIDGHVGNERKPTGSDVIKLPFCHAVLLESLRYNSIVPLINHFCSLRDVEFEGYCIPKGTLLFGCFWAAHRDETLFTDPWTFRPERFLDDQGRLLSVDHKLRKSLFPYGLGSRVCVGKSLSHIRLLVYTAAILQQFSILPPDETELLLNDPTLYKPGPVLLVPEFHCKMIPRSTSDS